MNYSEKFNSLCWHDSKLCSVEILPSATDQPDEVKMVVEWPNKSKGIVFFEDVYYFDAKMNFGAVGYPCILSADCLSRTLKLEEIKQIFGASGSSFDNFLHFQFEANGCRSDIEICARSFRLE